MPDIDPRSDKVVLHYTGDDAGSPAVFGVPARDLTENDVARLVYVEHGELSGAAATSATDALLERLLAGPYRRTPVAGGTKKVKAEAPTTEAATELEPEPTPADSGTSAPEA